MADDRHHVEGPNVFVSNSARRLGSTFKFRLNKNTIEDCAPPE
jgi:hypothetical protein